MQETVVAQLKEVIGLYDVGELTGFRRNERGFVNICYIIDTQTGGTPRPGREARPHRYFLRRYKKGIQAEELLFEHSLIDYLIAHGFRLVAPILRARDGRSFVQRFEDPHPQPLSFARLRTGSGTTGEGRGAPDDADHYAATCSVFYALFDFLHGDDRYTWINPACSKAEVASAARVLAQFHQAVFGFTPQGRRHEPKIIDLLPRIAVAATGCREKSKNTAFDAYLAENLETIGRNVRDTQQALAGAYTDLVQLVIHCDYHPGNLKFAGEEVVCLFDFDWSKIDVRCFDVALALFYFCAHWQGGRDGSFDLNKVACFLESYQAALVSTGGVGPLSDVELATMPHMIHASNLYVMNWTILDFYSKEVDVQEYLKYLRHGVRVMRWLEDKDNWQRLSRVFESIRM